MDAASPEPSRPPGPAPSPGSRVTVVDEQDAAVDTSRLARLAAHVLRALGVPDELELSVLCVAVDAMASLNAEHMGSTGPTDVLAFPIDPPDDVTPGVPGLLGDVVLCPPIAHAQAGDHGRSPDGEVDLLLVHGILHLLGHDHARPDDRARMFALTDELLTGAAAGGSAHAVAGGDAPRRDRS